MVMYSYCYVMYSFVMLCIIVVMYSFVMLCILIFMFTYSYSYVCSVLGILSSLCRSVYCLCVNVYCTTATG